MSFFTIFSRFKKHFVAILILTIILPSVYFSFPKKTKAVAGVADTVFDVPEEVTSIIDTGEQTGEGVVTSAVTAPSTVITAVATPVSAANETVQTGLSTADWTKKFVLDPLAMMLAKNIVQDITASTVKWINSGFNGNPAYVTDRKNFSATLQTRLRQIIFRQIAGLSKTCAVLFRPKSNWL